MSAIILGVTGSIAAYKACELTRLLVKAGHEVHVIMTAAGTEFVTPLTFRTLSRNSVSVGLFDDPATWVPGHVSLAMLANLVVVAPCTANVMAKLACGVADDMLTSTCLATSAPILLAPAMNTGMWENAATKANLKTLLSRGIKVAEAGVGELACGTSGKGRMAEPSEIFSAIQALLK